MSNTYNMPTPDNFKKRFDDVYLEIQLQAYMQHYTRKLVLLLESEASVEELHLVGWTRKIGERTHPELHDKIEMEFALVGWDAMIYSSEGRLCVSLKPLDKQPLDQKPWWRLWD